MSRTDFQFHPSGTAGRRRPIFLLQGRVPLRVRRETENMLVEQGSAAPQARKQLLTEIFRPLCLRRPYFLLSGKKYGKEAYLVGAYCVSFAPPQAAGLIHSVAPPLPTKLSFRGVPIMVFFENFPFCRKPSVPDRRLDSLPTGGRSLALLTSPLPRRIAGHDVFLAPFCRGGHCPPGEADNRYGVG